MSEHSLDYSLELQQCRQYFSSGNFEQLNKLFSPLLERKIPAALLTKVDFLMRQDPDKGIGYLLHLAEQNVPLANYKMAMLLYFHPELTMDFRLFLAKAYNNAELPAIIATIYLCFANKKNSVAHQVLQQHSHHTKIHQLLLALKIAVKTINKDDANELDFQQLERVNEQAGKLVSVNAEITLSTIDDFLNEFECNWLKLRAENHLEPSTVVDAVSGQKVQSAVRTNQFSQLIPSNEDWILLDIERRISRVINIPISHGEVSNILFYQQGNEYKPHYDFFHPKDPGSQLAMQDGGQRVKTVLCYLRASDTGGETYFPRLKEKLAGKQGQLIVFDNVSAQLQPLPLSLHQSLAVEQGEKWLLSKWFRIKETSYKANLLELNL